MIGCGGAKRGANVVGTERHAANDHHLALYVVAIGELQYYLERHGVPHRLSLYCEDVTA